MNLHSPSPRALLRLSVLALLLIGAFNYQTILDQYALATYHLNPSVAPIAQRLGLTRQAQAVLDRTQPRIDDKATFNTDCDTTKGELELGCFYRNRMYILQIDNPSLQPEMDVVTAHELLHAEWQRLSSTERTTLGRELERVYVQVADDDLRARMASYAQTEPGEEDNELHSILGTEYATLSPTLEAHYRTYFANRSVIVAAHQSYEAVFDTRRQELESQLSTIRSEKAQLTSLNNQMEAYRASGQISSYNALVPRQNALVDNINQQIAAYSTGVDEFNALSKSLDSQQITDTESAVSQ